MKIILNYGDQKYKLARTRISLEAQKLNNILSHFKVSSM